MFSGFSVNSLMAADWAAMIRNETNLSSLVAKIGHQVAQHHPDGGQTIQARWNAERRAAGKDYSKLEAMRDRWLVLLDEAAIEIERQRQAHFDANVARAHEEQLRTARNQWRDGLPIHATIRSLRRELEDLDRLVGVDDDASLLPVLDRITAALAKAESETSSERKAAAKRIRNATAHAVVKAGADALAA